MELILEAGYTKNISKSAVLEKASVKLNTLRLFIRLMKETRVFDIKKYITLQEKIDEVGRMLGGWIRSINLVQ
ncbi:MAG TPA: four helix bundle protein [Candidatus Paceibacterota bacterium]